MILCVVADSLPVMLLRFHHNSMEPHLVLNWIELLHVRTRISTLKAMPPLIGVDPTTGSSPSHSGPAVCTSCYAFSCGWERWIEDRVSGGIRSITLPSMSVSALDVSQPVSSNARSRRSWPVGPS